jgi:hypothetical protein
MNCIICNKIADEVGSHIIPASLIKNCVGKHYVEESYNLNSQNAIVDSYFGRGNLKNNSTKIKHNHYERDNILCKICEKKLGDLESKFVSEFLTKFRVDRFKNNFNKSISKKGYEIYEPKKLTNEEVIAYFYSIIFRFCKVYEIEDGDGYLESKDLLLIQKFLNGFLYQANKDYTKEIAKFNIEIIFNKYSEKSKFITTSDKLKNPYTFYFCEAIVLLFTKEISEKTKIHVGDVCNTYEQETTKIVVGPESLYNTMSDIISKIIGNEFVTKGVEVISKLNGKSNATNLIEFNELLSKHIKENRYLPITKMFDELKKKYSG